MSKPLGNADDRGPLIAWAIAVVLVGLIAVPAWRSKDLSSHPPGVIDVGTRGFAVKVTPSGTWRGRDDVVSPDENDRRYDNILDEIPERETLEELDGRPLM